MRKIADCCADTRQCKSQLLADSVAKRFLVPERGTFFQDQVRMGNIDSKIRHFGFYYRPFLAIGAASATFATQSALRVT